MIRILHVVTYMGRGGLETMLMNYYRHMDRSKVQFDFLVHRDFEADYDAEILRLGGHIYHLSMFNPLSVKYHKELDAFFKEHRYDVVHSHLDCLSAYPLAYAKKYGVRIRIAHAHNKNQDHNWKYIIKVVSKPFMPLFATNLFACSEEAGRWMFGKHTFMVLNNAIDAKLYRCISTEMNMEKEKSDIKDTFIIGHVGRFAPQKNHSFLIEVFKKLVEIEPDSKLLLVGSGDGMGLIKTRVRDYQLEDRVIFLGSRGDVPKILQSLDVFVFPSLYEGLGIAAVEAQAAGVPCVLSDQVPEECKVTKNVKFLSLEDSPETWAKCIAAYKTTAHTDTYDDICKAGYDIKKNAEALQGFYCDGVFNE